jgi:F-type H+-transporting ATPase subunit b
MGLFTPETGLIFWMLLVFGALVLLLGKFAWPVITKALADREQHITNSVKAADEAYQKLESVKEERIEILAQAREEQNAILMEVKALREKLLTEAKEHARKEADALIAEARLSIQSEREQALKEIRHQVALLSIQIAGKLVRKNLEGDAAQTELVNRMLDEANTLKN